MSSFTESKIISITNEEELNKLLEKKLTVIFFWADWHEPSKPQGQMDQLYHSLASKYGSICFASIEAEGFPFASEKFTVSVVPTFVGLCGSQVIGKVEGVLPSELDKLLKKLNDLPGEVSFCGCSDFWKFIFLFPLTVN